MILPHHENPPTKPATRNPLSPLPGNATRIKVSKAAELDFEEENELTETQTSAAEAPVSLDPSDGSIMWNFDVCLVVRVRSEGRSVLPYGELYRLFNAARSVGLKKKMWVGTDATTIVCKMARDALRPDVQCSKSDGGGVHKTKKKCKHLVVGETKQYAPQPSPDELQTFNVHYESLKVVDMDTEDPARALPSFPESAWRPTIVTAFSSNHVEVGLLLLRSLGRVAELQSEFNVSVVVWTMKEFPAVAAAALNCVVEELRTLHGVPTEVREFDFDAWPPWMRINQKLGYNGGRGEYAWKAVMIHTVLLERGFVYWADAGDRFRTVDGLTHTFRNLKLKGFASRRSSGQVKQWCHPRQLEYFRANVARIRQLPNCDASGIGFTLHKYSELARPWYECSITRQCIAPDGSSRRNHRQDQSALTVLAALTGNRCEGVHQGIHRNLDSKPQSYMMGVEATKCYKDPLRVKWQ